MYIVLNPPNRPSVIQFWVIKQVRRRDRRPRQATENPGDESLRALNVIVAAVQLGVTLGLPLELILLIAKHLGLEWTAAASEW
jgi:hypothetical protein